MRVKCGGTSTNESEELCHPHLLSVGILIFAASVSAWRRGSLLRRITDTATLYSSWTTNYNSTVV